MLVDCPVCRVAAGESCVPRLIRYGPHAGKIQDAAPHRERQQLAISLGLTEATPRRPQPPKPVVPRRLPGSFEQGKRR